MHARAVLARLAGAPLIRTFPVVHATRLQAATEARAMLDVRFEETRGALVVTPLVRTLDATIAAELRDAVAPLASGRRIVVVSLAHVRSMDASALAALVTILKKLPPGGEVRLAGVAPRVRSLLETTRLDEVFPTYADPADALPT